MNVMYRSKITDELVNMLRFKTGEEVDRLADKVGITRSAVYGWFAHRTRPNIAVAEAMLDAMGYEVIIRKVGEHD